MSKVHFFTKSLIDCVLCFGGFRGADGRNQAFSTWCVLQEHDCMIYFEPVWIKTSRFTWWPTQPFQRSGLHMFRYPDEGIVQKSVKDKVIENPANFFLVHYLFDDTVSLVERARKEDYDAFLERSITFASVGRVSEFVLVF